MQLCSAKFFEAIVELFAGAAGGSTEGRSSTVVPLQGTRSEGVPITVTSLSFTHDCGTNFVIE